MRTMNGGTLALLISIMAGSAGVSAQEPAMAEGRLGLRRGATAEAIMAMRDRLELTEAQIAALDEIRRETVARRSAEIAEAMEMRSRLRAGQIRRSEMMAFMEDRQDASVGVAEQRRARLEAVLTEEQIAALQSMRRGGRASMRGRAGVRGHRPSFRPNRGRGFRGRGFRRDQGPRVQP